MKKGRSIRTPVKREAAERYILLSLVSFAASVIVTRTFLQATGYPQLGGGNLHIAHVLWGGLLLFSAALLPLILDNRWVFSLSAILSGVGVGLFIDEVGKFITQTNDYFYPPAAPIIYAFFLLTVLLYMRVKRPPASTPRSVMYRVLDDLTEVLDRDLDPRERELIQLRLDEVTANADDPNLQNLASALSRFIEGKHLQITRNRPHFLQRLGRKIFPLYARAITQRRLKWFLVVALGGMGVVALIDFVILLAKVPAPGPALDAMLAPLVNSGQLRSAQEALWYLIRTALEGGTGLILIVSGGLIVVGRERTGIQVGTLMLVIWITVINLLAYYFDQFRAVATTLFQFFVLLTLTDYRRRFLKLS